MRKEIKPKHTDGQTSLDQSLSNLNNDIVWHKKRAEQTHQQLLHKIVEQQQKHIWINRCRTASYSFVIASILCLMFNLFIYDFLSLRSQPIVQQGLSLFSLPVTENVDRGSSIERGSIGEISDQQLHQWHLEIEKALDKIINTEDVDVKISSNPYTYLEKSKEEYQFLISLEEITLNKFLHDLENSFVNGLEHYIMAIICDEILGGESLQDTNRIYTGRDWYERYKYEVMYDEEFEAPFAIDWYEQIRNTRLEKPPLLNVMVNENRHKTTIESNSSLWMQNEDVARMPSTPTNISANAEASAATETIIASAQDIIYVHFDTHPKDFKVRIWQNETTSSIDVENRISHFPLKHHGSFSISSLPIPPSLEEQIIVEIEAAWLEGRAFYYFFIE